MTPCVSLLSGREIYTIDGPFFDNLKEKGINDEALCILSEQGITSSTMLSSCSQQSLAIVGIRLSDVLKLKNI